MLSTVKGYLRKMIRSILENEISSYLERNPNFADLKVVKNSKESPNSKIDNSFSFGKGIMFSITGTAKQILIESDVLCRNYVSFLVYPDATLIIHKNVFFNNFCSINCLLHIEIGESTIFGEGAKLYDHNHKHSYEGGSLNVARDEFTLGAIKIGKNCWVGSNVTILKGVEIGDNVIIGANNLIYKSIPANSIVKANTSYSTTQFGT